MRSHFHWLQQQTTQLQPNLQGYIRPRSPNQSPLMNIRRTPWNLNRIFFQSRLALFPTVMIIKVPARALTQLYTPKVDDVCSTLYSVSGTNERMGLLDCVVSRLDLVLCGQQLGFNWKSSTRTPFTWVSYKKKVQLHTQFRKFLSNTLSADGFGHGAWVAQALDVDCSHHEQVDGVGAKTLNGVLSSLDMIGHSLPAVAHRLAACNEAEWCQSLKCLESI